MVEDRFRELLRLVELDYERTSQFIQGVVGTSATIRGWAITVWLALLGFSLDRSVSALAFLAASVVPVFGIVDLYHTWLYREALNHARSLERITSSYYNAMGRGGGGTDLDLLADLQEELESHRFGMYSRMGPFRFRLFAARPYVFFRFLYPALLVVAIAAGILIDQGVLARKQPDSSRPGSRMEQLERQPPPKPVEPRTAAPDREIPRVGERPRPR